VHADNQWNTRNKLNGFSGICVVFRTLKHIKRPLGMAGRESMPSDQAEIRPISLTNPMFDNTIVVHGFIAE
jgi:hypothetical protein